MQALTLLDNLRQIAQAKVGERMPECLTTMAMAQHQGSWGGPLSEIARQSLAEIERLAEALQIEREQHADTLKKLLEARAGWLPIDTAPVPAWDTPEAQRGYGAFKCIGQLEVQTSSQPPWITTIEAYYVAAPRSTEKRILRWRDGAGRQCFPKYWQHLPEACSEHAGSKA